MMIIFQIIMSATVSFSESVPVEFNHTVETCLSAQSLWSHFDLALTNSKGSRLWPTKSSKVQGSGVSEEAIINVTYKAGLFSPTYSYRVSNISPLETFTYSAVPEDHPFEGGAQIDIIDHGEYRELVWDGLYQTPANARRHRRFFKKYSAKFFKQLNDNIGQLETVECSF